MNEIEQIGIGFILGSLLVLLLGASILLSLIVGIIGWCVLIIKLIYNTWKNSKNPGVIV